MADVVALHIDCIDVFARQLVLASLRRQYAFGERGLFSRASGYEEGEAHDKEGDADDGMDELQGKKEGKRHGKGCQLLVDHIEEDDSKEDHCEKGQGVLVARGGKAALADRTDKQRPCCKIGGGAEGNFDCDGRCGLDGICQAAREVLEHVAGNSTVDGGPKPCIPEGVDEEGRGKERQRLEQSDKDGFCQLIVA